MWDRAKLFSVLRECQLSLPLKVGTHYGLCCGEVKSGNNGPFVCMHRAYVDHKNKKFSRVSFDEIPWIWETSNNDFTSFRARFPGKSIWLVLMQRQKTEICKHWEKKLPVQTLLLTCLKVLSGQIRCIVKMLEDSTEGNSRKPQMLPHKRWKMHLLEQF